MVESESTIFLIFHSNSYMKVIFKASQEDADKLALSLGWDSTSDETSTEYLNRIYTSHFETLLSSL